MWTRERGQKSADKSPGCATYIVAVLLLTSFVEETSGIPTSPHSSSPPSLGAAVSGVRKQAGPDVGATNSTATPLSPLAMQQRESFIMCSMSLFGPPFENLTTPESHDLFTNAAIKALLYYSPGINWQHRVDVVGWCRLRGQGSECVLGPAYASTQPKSDQDEDDGEGARRAGERDGIWGKDDGTWGAAAARGNRRKQDGGRGRGVVSSPAVTLALQAEHRNEGRSKDEAEGHGVSEGEIVSVGTRPTRAKWGSNGATVHFRIVGPNVTSNTLGRLNGTNFLLRTRLIMAQQINVVDSQWAATLRFCPSTNTQAQPECNVTQLVKALVDDDDWFHLDLAIDWADFPTFDQVTDSFIVATIIGAMLTGGVIVGVSICCQQRRLKRLNENKTGMIKAATTTMTGARKSKRRGRGRGRGGLEEDKELGEQEMRDLKLQLDHD